jgi:hypothetical protein
MKNKVKLLNQLIDEIEFIENNAYLQGTADKLKKSNMYDKRLVGHKTKAFKIIDYLTYKENEKL